MARLKLDRLPSEGEMYGKYQLLEKIAVGGMAEIYRALSTSIGGFEKRVALKRILPHLTKDAEFVSLFIEEAKLTVSLSHSNIVQVIDFGRIDSNYFLAMELLDGRDLTRVLMKQSRAHTSMDVDAALYVVSEVLKGLEYAHTRRDARGEHLNLVHRDVSPHNVLVSWDGEVKLTDFGIAKARTRVSLTRPGVVLGKFAYMSPEQANGGDVDARSDIYSAGVTLYEMITGRRLFYAEDPAAILQRVRNPKVPHPSTYNPLISRDLDTIVMTALSPHREDRFSSAREMANALETELQTIAPSFNDSHLSRYMKGLFEDEVGAETFAMAAEHDVERATEKVPASLPRKSKPEARPRRAGALDDPILIALAEKALEAKNLWTLSDLSEHLERLGRRAEATQVLRVAGTKFAQNGLLVQAVALYVRVRDLEGWDAALTAEVQMLRGLPGCDNQRVLDHLGALDDTELGRFLATVVTLEGPSPSSNAVRSPLFSDLEGAEFANLVELLQLKRIAPATTIIREGEAGDSLCMIARGRALVYCTNFQGEKVYLSSLADGDCFGEFSFFTTEPRAATVEALEEVLLFEIQQDAFDEILDRFPGLTQALLAFYKGRVVATLLAKSEVFGVLEMRDRRVLIQQLTPEHRDAGEVILTEGERSDGFYLVKSGEVEVYLDRHDEYIFLDKLRSGEFFGEVAALTGAPRNASVRALGPCELLRLSGGALQRVLDDNPHLTQLLQERIVSREAERIRRTTAGGMLL